jgi:hypothetical protein
MGSTNFQNANLRLVVTDTSGIVNTASLSQTDSSFSGPFQVATVTVTHSQILTLGTVPVVVVAPSQTINHIGHLTQLFLPVGGIATLDASHGAYTNLASDNTLVLGWGSALDVSLGMSADLAGYDPTLSNNNILSQSTRQVFPFFFVAGAIWAQAGNDPLDDNALVVGMVNSLGNPTGGNSANTLKVSIVYIVMNL